MPVIHGSFPSFALASSGLFALHHAGVAFSRVSLISPQPPPTRREGRRPNADREPTFIGPDGVVEDFVRGVLAAGTAAMGRGLYGAGPLARALAGVGRGREASRVLVAKLAAAGVAPSEAIAATDALLVGRTLAILEVAAPKVEAARAVLAGAA